MEKSLSRILHLPSHALLLWKVYLLLLQHYLRFLTYAQNVTLVGGHRHCILLDLYVQQHRYEVCHGRPSQPHEGLCKRFPKSACMVYYMLRCKLVFFLGFFNLAVLPNSECKPFQAATWGVVGSAKYEYSALAPTVVDIGGTEGDLDTVVAEICTPRVPNHVRQ